MALSAALKRVSIGGVVGLLILGVALLALEGWHRARYRHFFGYGVHTDVVLGNSDVGKEDTYFGRVWNLSLSTIEIEGCRQPGGYAGGGILYQWDVQRFDVTQRQWNSLKGANNWVPKPFGGYDDDEKSNCLSEITPIYPLSAQTIGWVYKGWATKGDAVRMALHTSIKLPADAQRIIYTPIFNIQQ